MVLNMVQSRLRAPVGPSTILAGMDLLDDDPPVTGDEAADQALRQVARLGELPVAEHPVHLRQAQEALQRLLDADRHAA